MTTDTKRSYPGQTDATSPHPLWYNLRGSALHVSTWEARSCPPALHG